MRARDKRRCPKCEGKGTIGYRILASGQKVALGDGTTIEDMGGFGTRACSCVRDLPATDGNATWWESESVYSEVVPVPIGDEAVEISADCEVPRGDDGRRYHRTAENSYFPPLISVQTDRDSLMLHSDTARELAAALIAAADACDKADELCQATVPEPEDAEVSW